MIIRVQSQEGTKRINVSESDKLSKLYELTTEAFNFTPESGWELSRSRKLEDAFKRSSRSTIRSAKLK